MYYKLFILHRFCVTSVNNNISSQTLLIVSCQLYLLYLISNNVVHRLDSHTIS